MESIFKSAQPIAIFLLGLICTPIVETIKNYVQERKFLKIFLIELEDEIKLLTKRLLRVEDTVSMLENIIEDPNGNPPKYISTIRQINFLLLNSCLNNSIRLLSRSQRLAIKALIAQLAALNEISSKIYNVPPVEKNYSIFIHQYLSFLYTGCCTLESMHQILSKNEDAEELSDEEIINKVSKRIGMKITYRDLMHRKEKSKERMDLLTRRQEPKPRVGGGGLSH